jgi:hypothetical protein
VPSSNWTAIGLVTRTGAEFLSRASYAARGKGPSLDSEKMASASPLGRGTEVRTHSAGFVEELAVLKAQRSAHPVLQALVMSGYDESDSEITI